MAARLVLALALALAAQPAASVREPPTRLFADDAPIRFSLQGPISAVAGARPDSAISRPARLTLISPVAEVHDVLLSPRGHSRRREETCEFAPLRVTFSARPQSASLFERQRRLKLVTHCRRTPAFQQHVLLEYAAYRMFNRLSSTGLRARLASIDYVEPSGRPSVSRLGFFLEDPDHAAARNGLGQLRAVGRIPYSHLSPHEAAKVALFQYMIGNVDWSMHAAAAGTRCCHNVELLAPTSAVGPGIVPVPYDFDHSGLVDAPYAVAPEQLGISSVRQRRYRGYCLHNAHALAVAAEFRARRADLLAVLGAIPQLEERSRRSAAAYLDGFFRDIATDESVRRLFRTCIR